MSREDAKLDLVRALWRCFDGGRFEEARPLLADDFVALWPQTRERFRGPDNFIAVNGTYPGTWACKLERLEETPDGAISLVEISDGKETLWACSFFKIASRRIRVAACSRR